MSRILGLLMTGALLVGLCACGRTVKPDLPAPESAVVPKVIVVERRVYVGIPKELTRPEPIAEGPIAQCFEVASKRRAGQERSNARFKAISEIQGTEVKP